MGVRDDEEISPEWDSASFFFRLACFSRRVSGIRGYEEFVFLSLFWLICVVAGVFL